MHNSTVLKDLKRCKSKNHVFLSRPLKMWVFHACGSIKNSNIDVEDRIFLLHERKFLDFLAQFFNFFFLQRRSQFVACELCTKCREAGWPKHHFSFNGNHACPYNATKQGICLCVYCARGLDMLHVFAIPAEVKAKQAEMKSKGPKKLVQNIYRTFISYCLDMQKMPTCRPVSHLRLGCQSSH